MKKDRPKNPAVSMKKETYDRLKKEADRRGISVSALLEEIVGPPLGIAVGTPKRELDHRTAFGGPTGELSVPEDSPMLAGMRSR